MIPLRSFHVGTWLVEPRLGQLTRADAGTEDVHRQLPPKAMDVLVALASAPGDVVSNDQLRQAVWNGDFVSEDVVRQAIFQLRKAFEDDPEAPRFIATIPRRGYRLIAEVSHAPRALETEASDLEAPAPESKESAPARRGPGRQRRAGFGWLVTILGIVAILAFRLRAPSDGPGAGAGTVLADVVPLTTLPGLEVDPALSSDGERVALVHVPLAEGELPEPGGDRHLYVRQLDADAALRRTAPAGRISSPTWSPDSEEVAYVRYGEDRVEIVVYTMASGVDRVLVSWSDVWVGALSWSPRSDRMAMSVGERRDQPAAIHLFDLATLERCPWTSPPAGSVGDVVSAFSPDGSKLAFVRQQVRGIEDVFVVDARTGGTARRLTHLEAKIPALAWSADGASLVLSRYDAAAHGLWRLSLDGGLEAMPRYGLHPVDLTAAPGRLVFSEFSYDANLHRVDLESPQARRRPPVASTVWDASPDVSPDGSRIAFSSDRSGSSEIWTADLDGGNLVKHTTIGGPLTTHPRFSPDGRFLAFDSRHAGGADIFVVATGFGEPRRVTRHGGDDVRPTWSRDGQKLYFASNRGGTWDVWQIPVKGGEARRITFDGGMFALEDLDGSTLVYTRLGRPGLWRLAPGGEPELWIESLSVGNWGNWALGADAVFFVRREADETPWLVRRDRASGTVERLRRLRGDPENPGLALSPSGRHLVYAMVDRVESDLRLVRGPGSDSEPFSK